MLTLGQAAKETGLSKTAIARAIKNGRMSASKNEQGEYQIDPAELFRVYPVTGNIDGKTVHDTTPKDYTGLHVQLEALREVLRQIESERDDLRRRLDEEAADRREAQAKLTALLTYQPKAEPPSEVAEPKPTPTPAAYLGAAPWFWASLALAASSAAAWFWWHGQN